MDGRPGRGRGQQLEQDVAREEACKSFKPIRRRQVIRARPFLQNRSGNLGLTAIAAKAPTGGVLKKRIFT